ncbi:HpcH/HpaI aldolase/citrate lyase family protein [Qaidamihabitans albus]|uniref:HpcH/HpaI aldolase/citrate lyase family protein n=1 Tax=Qaidamihabitans albus TaxID=2795733 RepID=UPI0018F260C9|nr:aldolase/citrate lyase family protein [Qaidamihabitans albus]
MDNRVVPLLARSFLYVPAARPELFAKALSGPADAVIFDLEDAVPVDAKADARHAVTCWLLQDRTGSGTERWARINPDAVAPDLEAVAHPGLAGVFLAKCSRAGLHEVGAQLDRFETDRGLAPGSVRVVGLLESAEALADLAALVREPRLTTLGIGEVDLLAELRMTRSQRSAAAMDALRSHVVVHCAAAGLAAPVAPTSTAYRDLDAFAESTRDLRDLGFRSRTAIHPVQVPVIHEVLTPGDAALAAARDVLARFEASEGGVTTDEHGRLIDPAVVREARETVARASGR